MHVFSAPSTLQQLSDLGFPYPHAVGDLPVPRREADRQVICHDPAPPPRGLGPPLGGSDRHAAPAPSSSAARSVRAGNVQDLPFPPRGLGPEPQPESSLQKASSQVAAPRQVQVSQPTSDSGAADLHLSARSVLLPVERGSASSSSLQRQVSLDCASAEHSPSLTGLGSLTRVPSDPAVNSIKSVAAQLAAARPVSWRGSGDIMQASWAPQIPGRWLILDCWSGYGGLLLACLSLGMPSVVHIPRLEDLCVQMLVPFLKRRNICGILVGGGSPCQGTAR